MSGTGSRISETKMWEIQVTLQVKSFKELEYSKQLFYKVGNAWAEEGISDLKAYPRAGFWAKNGIERRTKNWLLCDVQKLNVFFKLTDQGIPVYILQGIADHQVSSIDILWTPPRETLQLSREVLVAIPTTTPIPGQYVTDMRKVAITISILFICLQQIQLQLYQPFSLPEEVHKRFSLVGRFNWIAPEFPVQITVIKAVIATRS